MNASPYQQVLYLLGPILYGLVYVFGVIYALSNLSRARGPAMLALIGCSIVLMMIVGQQVLVRFVAIRYGNPDVIPAAMALMAIPTAVGHLMIIIAVFAGRSSMSQSSVT